MPDNGIRDSLEWSTQCRGCGSQVADSWAPNPLQVEAEVETEPEDVEVVEEEETKKEITVRPQGDA